MTRALHLAILLALAGCGTLRQPPAASPCSLDEASYACQVERYHNVSVQ
jgi:hypothetical protein